MKRRDTTTPAQQGPRMNREIRVRSVRLIDDEGTQVGVVPTEQALSDARAKGLDLVEVSPDARPPVCKLMDYGKHKYRQAKKAKENRQARKDLKEIKIKPKIDDHDLNTKIRQARKFLSDGHKVKMSCRFRGREIVHINLMVDKLEVIAKGMSDLCKVDFAPTRDGRFLVMILAPSSGN